MNVLEYVGLGPRYRQDPFYVKYLMGKRVLDVDCGTWEFLVRDPLNFIGVDIDQQCVDCCRVRDLTAYRMSAFPGVS